MTGDWLACNLSRRPSKAKRNFPVKTYQSCHDPRFVKQRRKSSGTSTSPEQGGSWQTKRVSTEATGYCLRERRLATAEAYDQIPYAHSLSPRVGGQLFLGEAEAVPGAVVGADGPLARHALVVLEATADARDAIAGALRRALNLRVGVVCGHCFHRPGRAPEGRDRGKGQWFHARRREG